MPPRKIQPGGGPQELKLIQRRASNAERAANYRQRKKAKEILGLAEDAPIATTQARRIVAGNKLSLHHGAKSPERVGEIAAALMEALLNDPTTDDYLRQPIMGHEVLAWAHAEAQARLMRDWLDASGLSAAMTETVMTTENETPVSGGVHRKATSRKAASLMSELHKAETRAANRRQQLGLTPMSRARLGKDIASSQFDLARFWAEQDAADKTARGETG